MFKKTKCRKCKNSIKKTYEFCPHCGFKTNSDNRNDFGILGQKDFDDNFPEINPLLGSLSSGLLGGIFNQTMKMLEKEIGKEMRNAQKMNNENTNFELYINGKRINPSKIKFVEKPKVNEKKTDEKPSRILSAEKQKKFLVLKKEEPKIQLKRLSDSIIYEINVPGVKSVEDVSILKLENSIEIKAISERKAYVKILPISLPIINYEIEDGKLFLELEARN